MHPSAQSAATSASSAPHASGPSARKIEANRANAQKSTGPRTSQGKARSSQNALQHGLLAQAATLLAAKNEELEGLLDRYCAEFLPSGPHEEMLVRELAGSDYRLQQITRMETGVIWSQMQELYKTEFEGEDLSQADPHAMTLLLGTVWVRNPRTFSLLDRYQDHARRDYYRSLKQLQQIRTGQADYIPVPSMAQPVEPPPTPRPEPKPAMPDQTNPTQCKTAAAGAQTNHLMTARPADTPDNEHAVQPVDSKAVENCVRKNPTRTGVPLEASELPAFRFDIPNALDDFPFIDWREIRGPRDDDFDLLKFTT